MFLASRGKEKNWEVSYGLMKPVISLPSSSWTGLRLVIVIPIAIVITMMMGIRSRHGRNRELHLMNHPIMEGLGQCFSKCTSESFLT